MSDRFQAQRTLVITIDGLNASYLGPYGNTWFPTPFANRFASQSLLLESLYTHTLSPADFVSQSLETCLARASGLSGKASLATDVDDVCTQAASSGATVTQFDRLKSSRRMASSLERTLAMRWVSKSLEWLQRVEEGELLWLHASGLTQLWDAPVDLRLLLCDDEGPPPTRWLSAEEAQQARSSAEDIEDWQFQVQTTYAAQIQVWDFALSHLVDECSQRWADIPHVICLTSPRGLGTGIHGHCPDLDSLWDEVWQVPLMIKWDAASAGVRSHRLSSTSELGSVLADGFLGENHWAPDSWLSCRDRANLHDLAMISLESRTARAIKTPEWTLRMPEGQAAELYVRPDDRFQINDVADRVPDVVGELLSSRD